MPTRVQAPSLQRPLTLPAQAPITRAMAASVDVLDDEINRAAQNLGLPPGERLFEIMNTVSPESSEANFTGLSPEASRLLEVPRVMAALQNFAVENAGEQGIL